MAVVDLRNAEWYKRQSGIAGREHDGDFNAYPNDQIEKPEPWKIPNDEYRVITPDEYEEGTILKDRGFVVEDITDRYGRPVEGIQGQPQVPMHKGPYQPPQKDVGELMKDVPGVYTQNDSPLWNEGVTVDDVRKSHPPLAPLLERTIKDMQEAGELPSNSKKHGSSGIFSDAWTPDGRYDLYGLDPDWDMIPEKWGGPPVDDPEAVGSRLRDDGTWSEPTWKPEPGTRAYDFMRRLEFLKRKLENPWDEKQLSPEDQEELDDLLRERQYDDKGREVSPMMMLGGPKDKEVTNRGSVLPFVEYDDGSAGIGMPQWLHEPLEAWKRLQSYQPGTQDEQAVKDALTVGTAITGGSSAFSRPKGSIGMGGVPEKWTPDIMAQVAKDRKSGMTFRQLGEKYEVDHSRLAKLLKEYENSSLSGKDKFLEEQFQVDRFGRAINESMQEGYGTALQQRDYMKRLLETGSTPEDVSRKMFDRFGVEITPDQVRQRDMWKGTNERYLRDRYGRPQSPFEDD